MSYYWLFPLGLLLGAFGTLIGAGGGFLLVPLLLLLYPQDSPETITSISLAVVFFNASSGSIAYARMKRVDYFSGAIFAAAAIPGSMLGAVAVSYIPRRAFDGLFGVILFAVGIALLLRRPPESSPNAGTVGGGRTTRTVIEADGTRHVFSYSLPLGIGLSVLVGFVSSLLGIGGGIIHVPALVYLLNFPPHIATATSHFILAFMALAGSTVHLANGTLSQGLTRTAWLGAGALLGAQLGARVSRRVHGRWILRSLAVGVIFVGVRVFLLAL